MSDDMQQWAQVADLRAKLQAAERERVALAAAMKQSADGCAVCRTLMQQTVDGKRATAILAEHDREVARRCYEIAKSNTTYSWEVALQIDREFGVTEKS